ncbi:hypothetical protein AB0B15_11765 [Streptomyces sp. NPDC045456]|uniref:hypothetical protein n=1 Tax=Streptomyces sp. NPDC045456 TaxID=3155254 RepID=UPI0034115290
MQCIEHVLRGATYEGPATGANNVSYTLSTRELDAIVIVNAENNNVVTAYTSQGGTSASNNWDACVRIPASAQRTPAAAKSDAAPKSGSSCWLDWFGIRSVCLNVQGEKLHVDTLDASESYAPGTGYTCATPMLYANGHMFRMGYRSCGQGTIRQHFVMNNNFPDQTRLCLGWNDIGARACLTVHD